MKWKILSIVFFVLLMFTGCSDEGDSASSSTIISNSITPYASNGSISGTIDLSATASSSIVTHSRSLSGVGSLDVVLANVPAMVKETPTEVDAESSHVPTPLTHPQSVTINADGSYNVTDLPSGHYALVYLDGNGNGKKVDDIIVLPNEATTQNIASVGVTGSVTLKVVNLLTASTLSNATVYLNELDYNTTTDSNGLASFDNLPSGKYSLSIFKDGFVPKHSFFSVANGQETDLHTIELSSEKGSLSGSVDIANLDDLSNIYVYLQTLDGSVYTTLTNANGSYFFPALPVGVGYSAICYAHDYKSKKVDNIDITANHTTTVQTITLSQASTNGSLSGFVRFNDVNETIEHAGIIVSVEGTDFEAITSRDGSYIINNIPIGDYTINFTHANYDTRTQNVTIVKAANLQLLNTQLIAEVGNLIGYVSDDANQPVSNVNIYLTTPKQTFSTVTDANGTFAFNGIISGEHILNSSKEGYGVATQTISITASATTDITSSAITLDRKLLIGIVNLDGEIDHSGATVSLQGSSLSDATSIPAGTFTMYGLEAGNYQLQVTKSGYGVATQTISITASATTDITSSAITLDRKLLIGIVNLDGEIDHSGATVSLQGSSLSDATSIPAGTFTMYGLEAGNYQLQVTKSGYVTSEVPLAIFDDNGYIIAYVINLIKAEGTASGTVQLEGLNSYDGTSITLYDDENRSFTAITSSSGAWSKVLPEGNYTKVVYSRAGYAEQENVSSFYITNGLFTNLNGISLHKLKLFENDFSDISLQSTIASYEIPLVQTDVTTDTVIFSVTSSDPEAVSASIDHTGKLLLSPQGSIGEDTTITMQASSGIVNDIRAFAVTVAERSSLWDINATLNLNEDTSISANFENNESYSLSSNGTHATATLENNGSLTIAPSLNYFGSDILEIISNTSPFTLNLNYNSVNDAPTIDISPELSVGGNQAYTYSFSPSDVENDSSEFNSTLISAPEYSNTALTNTSSNLFIIYCKADVNGTVADPFETNVTSSNYQDMIEQLAFLIDNNTSIEVCNDAAIASYTISNIATYGYTFTPDRVGTYNYELSIDDGNDTNVYPYTVTVTEAWQPFKEGFFSISPLFGGYDLAMDNGKMYAVYGSFYNDSKVELIEYNGTAWALMSLEGIRTAPSVKQFEIKTYQGELYLMIVSDHNPGTVDQDALDVYKYAGSAWTTIGGGTIETNAYQATSYFQVDETGIYVSLSDGSYSNIFNGSSGQDTNTSVYQLVNDQWQVVTGDGYIQDEVYATPTVLMSKGEVYTVPYSWGGSDLNVSYYNSGTTTWDDLPSYSNGEPIHTKGFAMIDGKPVILISTAHGDSNLTVITYDGSSWSTLGSAKFAEANTGYAITMSYVADTLYVAYSSLDYELVVMRLVNGIWEPLGEAVSLHDMGGTSSRRIIADYDKPYILYSDWADDGLTYLNLMHFADLSPELQTASPSKFGKAYATQNILLSFSTPLTSATVILQDENGTSIDINYSITDNSIEIIPTTDLQLSTDYKVVITDTLSTDGYQSSFTSTYSFETQSITPAFKTGLASLVDYDDGNYSRGSTHSYTAVDVNDTNSQYIIRDNVTELMWDDDVNTPQTTWDDALTYCEDYSYGGYDDWRLPTFNELFTLVYLSQQSPALFPATFTNSHLDQYWTGSLTPYYNPSVYALQRTFVSLEYGFYDIAYKTAELSVKCVRGTEDDETFSRDDTHGIVTDHKRGVMWQDDSGVSQSQSSLSGSITYCEDLTLGGYTNWSLPNLNEMASIVDLEQYGFGINPAFQNDRGYYYWTSSLDTANSTDTAWLVYSGGGNSNLIYGSLISDRFYARCMRVIE